MSQDNFSILEKISESSTTTVFKAHQNVLDRTVLLKVLHKHLLRDKNLVARFTREARACALLSSENIVQVYDLTEVEGAPTIVMEYVEGKSLEEMLFDRIYSEEFLIKIAVSVLNALSYAHERGIVHRDIKPGNILVSEDGVVKVTDFGLAAVSDAPSLTMEGSLIGTPAYMSPEQARGEPVDGRTDLFSLGVTLVEVLTGEKILLGKSYAECISNIQNFRQDSLDKFSDKCSPHVFEFLKRLLSPEKSLRFLSAEMALKFLSPYVVEDEHVSRERHLRRRLRRLVVKRKKNSLLLAGIGIGIVIAGILFLSLRSPTGKNAMSISNASSPPVSGSAPASRGLFNRRKPDSDDIRTASKATDNDGSSQVTGSDQTGDTKAASQSVYHDDIVAAAGNDSGYISIDCKPWADVYIDSEYIGKTPISGSFKVAVGKHTVMCNNPYFVPIVRDVIVQPKAQSSVNADFLSSAGYISITVNPWGEIFIDDLDRGITPISQPIVVSSGVRKLRIHNPKFKDIEQKVVVNPVDTLKLEFDLLTGIEK
ncbi:MAG: protein kinase domain-containing protein [Candidatus Kryptoniota bacterium]